MSQIRCVYHGGPPPFPATDQHPGAARYQVGGVWLDAVGGEPSQAELDAVLASTAPPLTVADVVEVLEATGSAGVKAAIAAKKLAGGSKG